VYEQITVEIDRSYGDGTHRSHSVSFTGRLVQLIEEGYTTMRLYEWVDRSYMVYLVHVEEAKPEQRPQRTLYHSSTPTPAVYLFLGDTPQRKFLGLTRNSPRGHFCFSGVPKVRQQGKEHTPTRYQLAEGELLSTLKLEATGYGYLGPSTTPKLTGKRRQGLTQPERHTRWD
jgi:hypothetical protein